MRSIERVSPLVRDARTVSSDSGTDSALLEELQVRIEAVAIEVLPPIEAELARTLAALLVCIERLASISRIEEYDEPVSRSSRPTSLVAPETEVTNVYEALEREAAALIQSGREQPASSSQCVVGAVRQVEQAERDLLWGRVDDLAERVKLLSRRRADDMDDSNDLIPDRGDAVLPEDAELPRYSLDGGASAHPNLPPAYYGDGIDFADEKREVVWDSKPSHSLSPVSLDPSVSGQPQARIRKTSSAHSEKMQRDLDIVSQAIERLYVVSPQLADQRVEPDRRKVRERQLVKLGNAIERLSQGRLEDQRALALPAEEDEVGAAGEERRRVKTREREKLAMDRLLDQIDRAASRTLADQRVELNGKRKEVLNFETVNPGFEPLADKYEARRRTYILEHTGKGRLESQDAKLQAHVAPAPFPPPPVGLDESVTINEFFAEGLGQHAVHDGDSNPRQRSQSLPGVRKKFSSPSLFRSKTPVGDDTKSGSSATKNASLRCCLLKKPAALSLSSRRGSYDMSGMTGLGVFGTGMSRTPSTGIQVLEDPQFDWVAEESRNLGSLVVTFWPRSIPEESAEAIVEDYEVVAVESEAILVAPAQGGPATRISLPCPVVPQKAPAVSAVGACYEVQLVTTGLSFPTKSRADLEVHVPLSTEELRAMAPLSFRCATCDAEVVDAAPIKRYNALPSEYWAELLDAWMCHQDQTLSNDLIAKGKGIKPRSDEALVGTTYVLLPQDVTRNWVTADGEPSKANNGDLLFDALCASCSSLIGSLVRPVGSKPDEDGAFRLLKYASYPVSSLPDGEQPTAHRRHSLAKYITAELLETGQAHACHRFVLENSEDEHARLLLWFFNPAIRVAFSSTATATSVLGAPTANVPSPSTSSSPDDVPQTLSPPQASPKATHGSLNAAKIFYAVVSGEDDPAYTNFTQAKTERVAYPRAVVDRVEQLLRASTLVYPPAKRLFGELAVGFLERI